jgi:uncharacterized protein YraI
MTESLVGHKLGKYLVQSEIGRGGMGVVYRGYDPALDRLVAIKVLPPALLNDAQFVQRFHQEAVLAARLQHPGIVPIHDVGEQAGIHYIVMQYLEGTTLEDWLARQGPLAPAQAKPILRQLAEALDFAHGRGVIHRDVKPANVMISPEGRATLMDFGLVRAAEGTSLTRTGMVMGTPEYMSPEQALGEEVDGRSDIYSLGIMLYKMLSGKVPFARTTPYAITYAHIHEPPPPLRESRPDLPAALELVVNKALAKRREDRYPRARLLADDFDAAAAGKAVGAGAAARAAPAGVGPAPARTSTPGARTAAAGAGPPRWVAWVAGALVLLIAVAVITRLASRGADEAAGRTTSRAPAASTVEQGALNTETTAPTGTIAAVAGGTTPATETAPSGGAVTRTLSPTAIPRREATASPTAAPVRGSGPSFGVRQGLDAVNVRSGPGTAYAKVGELKPGQQYPVTGKNAAGDWLQFSFNGQPAWISTGVVAAGGDLAAAPVVSVAPANGAVTLSMKPVANANTSDGYVNPPQGVRTLSGVEFDLGAGESTTTQAGTLSGNPTQVNFATDVSGAQAVYLLLTGGNMYDRYQGQTVGQVRLDFASGASRTLDLVVGANIREWKQGSGVVTATTGQDLVEVWTGANKFDSSTAVIDRLKVEVPAPLRNDRLTGVQIVDTSAETAGGLDPAINVLGVTVLAGQEAPQAQAAAVPPIATPRPTSPPKACGAAAGPTFARLWKRDVMGCPVGNEFGLTTAYETFERGWMVWRSDNQRHYALLDDGNYASFLYQLGEPPNFDCAEAEALGKPRRGFSQVWCKNPDVRARIGNATGDEIGDSRPVQEFENGFMIYVKERGQIASVMKNGRWSEQP